MPSVSGIQMSSSTGRALAAHAAAASAAFAGRVDRVALLPRGSPGRVPGCRSRHRRRGCAR
jgi:hypothetical protein